MKPLSERIKDFPADQFVDWLCLSCVDVREVRNEEDAQDEINKIRKAVTERLTALEKQRDALAAENGLAAKAVQTFCDVVGSNTDVIAEEMGMDGAKAILAAMSATGNMPATDDYLNSVRAEGVQMLLASLPPHYTARTDIEQFAAQLRAGKDGE